MEDAVFAFQDCIMNGTKLKSVEDIELPKPKTTRSKGSKFSNGAVFDNSILDELPIDALSLDIDDFDMSNAIDLSDLLLDD